MFFPMENIACGATWAPFLNKTHIIVHFDISKKSPIHKWGLAVFNHVNIWYGSRQHQNGSNLTYNLVVSGICKICRQELLQFSDLWLWYMTRGLIDVSLHLESLRVWPTTCHSHGRGLTPNIHMWIGKHYGFVTTLEWRHNGCDGVSNLEPHHCLLNRLFRRRSKKTPKLRVNSPHK